MREVLSHKVFQYLVVIPALFGTQIGAALAAPETVSGVPRVLDGDTLIVQGVRVRLWGVDAPETEQTCRHASGVTWTCGVAATEALKERLGGQPVTCERRDTDQYGRMVATCSVGATDLGAWLLVNGWAITYWRQVPEYAALQRMARSNGAGIWSGTFTKPADWRRVRR